MKTNEKTTTNGQKVGCSELFDLLNKWEGKINDLKCSAAGQHAIPKSRINAEIKGIRLCKKHLKSILSNVKLNRRT